MDKRVRLGMAVALCLGLSACGSSPISSPEASVDALPVPTAGPRTLAPEGPVATLTPTPYTSPRVASSPSPPAPGPTPSVEATPERDEDTKTVVPPKPKKSKKPSKAPAANCDPNYSGACVPIVSWDLDCADIRQTVKVEGTDIHRFDADRDGYGCESY